MILSSCTNVLHIILCWRSGAPTITQNQLTCLPVEWSKQMFLEHSTTVPVFGCPCPHLFETLLACQTLSMLFLYCNVDFIFRFYCQKWLTIYHILFYFNSILISKSAWYKFQCFIVFSSEVWAWENRKLCTFKVKWSWWTLSYTHLLRTISIGTPGFTIAIFIHSLPRSTDMTATDTANTKAFYVKLVRHRANTKDPEIQ